MGCVDFVHGRLDVEAGVVDEVDGGRRGYARWRGDGNLAEFAADAGYGAREGRDQHQALAINGGGFSLSLGGDDIGLRGIARSAPGASLGTGAFFDTGGNEAAFYQLRLAYGLALGIFGDGTGFMYAPARSGELCLVDRQSGIQVFMPQPHQHLPGFHPVAFLHAQIVDTPTDDGGHLGALAGFDFAGAGVGQGGLDLAMAHFLHHDQDGFRSGKPPAGCRQQGQHDKDGEQAAQAFHGGELSRWLTCCSLPTNPSASPCG